MKMNKFFASVGGAGYLPLAPGTWGAAVGALALLPLQSMAAFPLLILLILSSFILTWLGAIVAQKLEPEWGEDPKQYVMDEFVGVWVAMIGHSLSPINILLGFILFRIFDIAKPLGIRRFERVPKGWGVMLDDVAAGIYANIVLSFIQIFFIL